MADDEDDAKTSSEADHAHEDGVHQLAGPSVAHADIRGTENKM